MSRKERKTITKDIFDIIRNMFQTGKSNINEIAQSTGLNRKTVSNQIKRIESEVGFESAYKKMNRTCQIRNETLNDVENTILNSIARNNSNTQVEVKKIVEEEHNVKLSKSTVCRIFKKLKRKRLTYVPNERNTSERIDARAEYATYISRYADDKLVFLDETGFNEHSKRYYGYAPSNEPAYINVPANKGRNNSVMVALSNERIVAYKQQDMAYNKVSFEAFITEYLVPYFRQHPSKILIMDNASFHRSPEIKQLLITKGIVHKYLTPYSPQLNPIEEFFSFIKSKFNNIRNQDATITVKDAIDMVLDHNNDYSDQILGFYRHMRKWLDLARRREHFI